MGSRSAGSQPRPRDRHTAAPMRHQRHSLPPRTEWTGWVRLRSVAAEAERRHGPLPRDRPGDEVPPIVDWARQPACLFWNVCRERVNAGGSNLGIGAGTPWLTRTNGAWAAIQQSAARGPPASGHLPAGRRTARPPNCSVAGRGYWEVQPPSTGKIAPVTSPAARDARKITAAATSSVVPTRPTGMLARTPARNAGLSSRSAVPGV